MKLHYLLPLSLLFILASCSNGNSVINTGRISGQSLVEITSSPTLSSETRQLDNFTGIRLDGVYEVTFLQDSTQKPNAKIEGHENLLKLVELRNKNGTLTLDFKKGYRIANYHKLHVTLTGNRLSEITVNGTGTFSSPGISTDDCNISLTGVGSIEIGNLSGKTADIKNTGVGSIEIGNLSGKTADIENKSVGSIEIGKASFSSVELHNTGVGSISITGKAGHAEMSNSGVGSIDAAGLITNTLTAKNTGIGSIEAHATQSATYCNTGVGSVDIEGEGKIKKN